MSQNNLDNDLLKEEVQTEENSELIKKIEKAYRIYKLSELYLKDVADDYGKYKIARLRMDFAQHELLTLLEEARNKGVQCRNNDKIRKYMQPE